MIQSIFISAFLIIIATAINKNLRVNGLLFISVIAILHFYYEVFEDGYTALCILGVCIGGQLSIWLKIDKKV